MGGPLLPTAPTPRERERRGGQPAQRWSAEEGQEGSADGEAEATQELILAVVQEGAEGQCQGQGSGISSLLPTPQGDGRSLQLPAGLVLLHADHPGEHPHQQWFQVRMRSRAGRATPCALCGVRST